MRKIMTNCFQTPQGISFRSVFICKSVARYSSKSFNQSVVEFEKLFEVEDNHASVDLVRNDYGMDRIDVCAEMHNTILDFSLSERDRATNFSSEPFSSTVALFCLRFPESIPNTFFASSLAWTKLSIRSADVAPRDIRTGRLHCEHPEHNGYYFSL